VATERQHLVWRLVLTVSFWFLLLRFDYSGTSQLCARFRCAALDVMLSAEVWRVCLARATN
jgi:hypothetical protein